MKYFFFLAQRATTAHNPRVIVLLPLSYVIPRHALDLIFEMSEICVMAYQMWCSMVVSLHEPSTLDSRRPLVLQWRCCYQCPEKVLNELHANEIIDRLSVVAFHEGQGHL